MFDLTFRTYMDYRIDASDAQNLSVMGRSGALAGDKVYFNVSGFEYVDGNWTFQVANANPFHVSFDWSAWTKYLLFPESPSMDVGGDGTLEWQGTNVSTVRPLEVTAGVQRVVDTEGWPDTYEDLFGNVFYRVPINVSSTSEGNLALRNLVVLYNGSVTTTDLSGVLNELKEEAVADEDGMVSIPINVTSKSAGTLKVTSVDVLYDLPPYSLRFPDVMVPEDTVSDPLDLDSVVFDDHDNNNLEYTVVRESGDEEVMFNHSEDDVVTFYGPANWSGAAVFHVVAVDSSNLTYRTNRFNVTVAPVEDPPLIHGLEEGYVVYFGIERTVAIEVDDNDTDLENITITTSTTRVWGDAANGTISFLYPFSGVFEVVEINISDGVAWSLYSVNVSPEKSNEPPVVTLPQGIVVVMDAQVVIDMWPYGKDLETEFVDLVWEVVDFPQDLVVTMRDDHLLQVIPVATQAGEHLIAVSCADTDGNVVFDNLTVRLIEENRHPPVILRGPEALPGVIKVEVDGKEDINLALQKYWYDQEDYNQPQKLRWEVESLRPSLFSVGLDNNQKLTITAFGNEGAGYFTILLIDSDGDVSDTESVQVRVVEPEETTSSWLIFAVVAVILVVVVVVFMLAGRGGEAKEGPKVEPKVEAVPVTVKKERRAPPRKDVKRTEEVEEAEEAPPAEMVPGSISELLVIHESTSLITQRSRGGKYDLPEDKADELIEMSTLFAQERFEDTNVGTIKAFKFNGDEVLVGKGRSYFLVARCSGTEFDDIAHEMKRSIVNIDVNLTDKLSNWYPGQKVAPLEEELRELLSEGSP